jgi:hypothetical protein
MGRLWFNHWCFGSSCRYCRALSLHQILYDHIIGTDKYGLSHAGGRNLAISSFWNRQQVLDSATAKTVSSATTQMSPQQQIQLSSFKSFITIIPSFSIVTSTSLENHMLVRLANIHRASRFCKASLACLSILSFLLIAATPH